jgi:hypothetical protein
MIQDGRRMGRREAMGYGKQPVSQTVMFWYKQIIGRGFGARSLPAQKKIETKIGYLVIAHMTRHGMPKSQHAA